MQGVVPFKRGQVGSEQDYQRLHEESLSHPDQFWAREAKELHWMTPFQQVKDRVEDKAGYEAHEQTWFAGGETNLCYNCVDRHIENGHGDRTAIIFERENEEPAIYSYARLHEQVCRLANVLEKTFCIQSEDRVMIYLSCRVENVIAMLACARIGAIHTVVFGGFSPAQIRHRIEECAPKLIITATGFVRRRKFIDLKVNVDEAIVGFEENIAVLVLGLSDSSGKQPLESPSNYHDYNTSLSAPGIDSTHSCSALSSEHPSFILYTSGSTGAPKGLYHSTGGYMVGAYATCKYILGLSTESPTLTNAKEEDSSQDRVYWCTADMGWITGHTYVTYGPLLHGATQIIYEGAFDTPDMDCFFRMIEKHRVTTLYTAPTLLRTLKGRSNPEKFDLSTLELLGTVGEPISPDTWQWYFDVVGQGKCPIVDTWWQTETGGHMISPIPGVTMSTPGCATIPFFGVDPVILNDLGKEVQDGTSGRLFIRSPWPSMLRGMWNRSVEEFKNKYFPENLGMYYSGDNAVKCPETGYITILGRSDDVMNISGHRVGTSEVESAIASHEMISKVAVIPRPDPLTGQSILAFTVLTAASRDANNKPWTLGKNEELRSIVAQHVRHELAAFVIPKTVVVVDALPETKSGKTMRGLLAAIAGLSDESCEKVRATKLQELEDRFSTMDKDSSPDDSSLLKKIASLVW